MRKAILNIHMYLLLACSSYLIIFGVSSLLYQHPIRREPQKQTWTVAFDPRNAAGDAVALCERVREELGLFGWSLPWEARREPDGTWVGSIAQPARRYALRMPPSRDRIEVTETRQGIFGVLHFLHGGMEVPGSPIASTWRWYTRLCSVAVLFAAASGVYLFASRRTRHAAGWAALGVGTAVSLAMFAWITLGA